MYTESLLVITKLSKSFGGLAAIKDLELEVRTGEIVGLIGPNGSGKTTLFNCISGIYSPSKGEIWFKGEKISHLKPHVIAAKGIGRTFQITTLYENFTVFDNIRMGSYNQTKLNLWKTTLNLKSYKEEERAIFDEISELIEFLELKDYKDFLAKNLPYGHQRRLSVAIALATHPDLLLLDEPMCGMNPEETNRMVSLIQKIRDRGITILLVEHNMRAVMGLCDRIIAINYGTKIAEGSSQDIQTNKHVIEAYLGSEYDLT